MKLMDLKVSNKWTVKSFDSLLKLLKDALPNGKQVACIALQCKEQDDEGEFRVQVDSYLQIYALFWKKYAEKKWVSSL